MSAQGFSYPPEKTQQLIELSLALNSTLNLSELLKLIITTAADVIDCEAASIMMFDDSQPQLLFAASTDLKTNQMAENAVPIEGSVAGTIFRMNKAMILNDVKSDPRHYVAISHQTNIDVRTLLGVPMRIQERTTGVLEALNKRNGPFTEVDERILSVIAAHAAVALQNARLVMELQEAYQKVSDADRVKSNFLALASHELRTPLGIIIGYASFLREDSQGEISEHADQVMIAALQMRALIDDMTHLTMLKSNGLMSIKLEELVIANVIDKACQSVSELVRIKNLSLYTYDTDKELLVYADSKKLASALTNILNNAVRFTKSGGKISVGAREQDDQVLIWIQDDGIGLEVTQLEKVFEEFYQGESHMTRRTGGLGVGLSITRGLIEAQGGKVWAESDGPGKGTIFKIILPRA